MHWVSTQSTVIYTRWFMPVHVKKRLLLLHFLYELRGSAPLDNPPGLRRCRESLGREGRWQRDEFFPVVGQWNKDGLTCLSPFAPAQNLRRASLMSCCLSQTWTHWQERRGEGETSQRLSAKWVSSSTIWPAVCLKPLPALRSLEVVDARSLDTHTYTLCLR